MIDHLEIYTADIGAARRFYSLTLAPLGYSQQVDSHTNGFGDGTSLDFFFAEGDPHRHVHFAFAAPDRATVDRIYAEATTAGLTLDRAPALAPNIHENYYVAYLRDPDGRLIEFVCQRAEPSA